MKEELKSCPFCNGNDLEVKRNMELDGMTFIICGGCGLVSSFQGRIMERQTIEAWNTRPDSDKDV